MFLFKTTELQKGGREGAKRRFYEKLFFNFWLIPDSKHLIAVSYSLLERGSFMTSLEIVMSCSVTFLLVQSSIFLISNFDSIF